MDETARTVRELTTYLEQILGTRVTARQWPEASLLAPFLTERYSFHRIEIFDRPCVVMLDRGVERNTPATIGRHRRLVGVRWAENIVYAAATLSATDRARLVAAGVPFVVPGRQLFLPPLGIDFREHFSSAEAHTGALGPVAQLIILGILSGKGWAGEGATVLAGRLGYTKMTVGRAFVELEAAGLAEVRSTGRNRRLDVVDRGESLWRRAQPLLRSPIRSVVESAAPFAGWERFVSGFSALSEYTKLAQPETPTFAVPSPRPGRTTRSPRRPDRPVSAATDSTVLLERWFYDPALLAENGRVDRLSLYLSLRGHPDERVEQALDELLAGMSW